MPPLGCSTFLDDRENFPCDTFSHAGSIVSDSLHHVLVLFTSHLCDLDGCHSLVLQRSASGCVLWVMRSASFVGAILEYSFVICSWLLSTIQRGEPQLASLSPSGESWRGAPSTLQLWCKCECRAETRSSYAEPQPTIASASIADAKVQHQGWGLQGKVRVFYMSSGCFPKCLQKVAPYFWRGLKFQPMYFSHMQGRSDNQSKFGPVSQKLHCDSFATGTIPPSHTFL